jgi:hypothetical protein
MYDEQGIEYYEQKFRPQRIKWLLRSYVTQSPTHCRSIASTTSSWRATHSAKAPSVRGKELLFIGALWRNCALIGVLGGSQNRRHTGALKPVGEPDSFGIAVKALAKSRIRIRSYPDQKID